MRQLIESLVRDMLNPYLERMEELSDETEDLRRRQQNMIRLGYVSEVHESGFLVRVKHGELVTPFIRWFANAAGETSDYRCPSVGEQAVILNYGAGHNGTQTVALIGLFSDNFPAPSTDPNEIVRCYPDGSIVSYHAVNHVLKLDIKGDAIIDIEKSATVNVGTSASIDVGESASIKAGGEVTVDGSKIKLNGGVGVVTGAHKCMITGTPHADCSSTVTAAQ
ncbi:phage baseplate assembly protein V [Marinomonas transparens]|uniref:Phage baseplate assembly protein V n=1 Tax=Marinomonas transparens TaxID=2795388 RepID=A0A934JN98_9GAMM|nr:phage baseplate assembly protein V [Marinomonas transparens]MBJ7536643.1 phage baseplate assembly protein V [Marinomonas transparens]